MITFSDDAIGYLESLLEKQEEGTGIRVFIDQAGTPFAEACLSYCNPSDVEDEDVFSFSCASFKVWVDNASKMHLQDAQVGYETDEIGGQLTIKAPNAKVPQISGDATLEERINYILHSEINPGLASHGGMVSLIEVVEQTEGEPQDEGADKEVREEGLVAVLQFGGGCQGCSAVDMTLKHGVEQTLLQRIPELVGVKDATDHTDTQNAWM